MTQDEKYNRIIDWTYMFTIDTVGGNGVHVVMKNAEQVAMRKFTFNTLHEAIESCYDILSIWLWTLCNEIEQGK